MGKDQKEPKRRRARPLALRRGARRPYILLGALIISIVIAFALLGGRGPTGLLYDASAPVLTKDGKLLVLYVGAEYCPFCAAERWAIVLALSEFGTWSGLRPSTSAPASIEPSLPDLPTYTFVNATYSSATVAFEGYEIADRLRKPLQALSPLAEQLLQKYDPTLSIPFLMIGGKYYRVGSGIDASLLVGMTFDQVQSQLQARQGKLFDAINREASLIAGAIRALLAKPAAGTMAELLLAPSQYTRLAA
jgi:thiol-disulfide isomerase/thioredoxin